MKSVGQNINIMTVSATHAEVFAGLHTACFPKAWSSEAFAKLLNMPGVMGFITTQNDNKEAAIGFALISNAGVEAEIVTLGVLPGMQRQGIGTHLINAIHKTCLECNTASVFLEVNSQDTSTVSFYRNAGYECVGTRERYYKHVDAPADDALVMCKMLEILES
jgi:ribosomal-protein-alanine N-acetyltransferase